MNSPRYFPFWAYIHSVDRTIHIKQDHNDPFLPHHRGEMSDLDYAIREYKEGNTNIFAIVPTHIYAPSLSDAHQLAQRFFTDMGLIQQQNGQWLTPYETWAKGKPNRFSRLLEDE